MKHLHAIQKLKTIGLNRDMPDQIDDRGQLNTNQAIFLLKGAIFELLSRIEELEFKVAELKGEVEE